MKSFIGTYECKIDDKGRLKVPSSLIKQMENFDDKAFVVKRSVFQSCLEVYPITAWDKMMGKINKLNRFVKKNADFIRMFTAGVKTVELDNAGRLQISKDLTVFAGLQKDIVITGAGELFEVWDKEADEKGLSIDEAEFVSLSVHGIGALDGETGGIG